MNKFTKAPETGKEGINRLTSSGHGLIIQPLTDEYNIKIADNNKEV